jgi:hypothetical protein
MSTNERTVTSARGMSYITTDLGPNESAYSSAFVESDIEADNSY